ncbi:hypothetical protein OAL13_00235 [bacterium]|nr:hypothetical protein [bacterium]
MTTELNLDELKAAVFEKCQEAWEDGENFDHDSVISFFSDAKEELGVELEDDTDEFEAVKDNLKDMFFVYPIDEVMEQLGVDATPAQHKAAKDATDFLNYMFNTGCYVGQVVLADYLEEHYPVEEREAIAELVSI